MRRASKIGIVLWTDPSVPDFQMQLKIMQVGEPVLRQPAREVSASELGLAAMKQLIELMRETMREAPGVGIAAPQIGVPVQIALIEDRVELLKDLPQELLAERERVPVPLQILVNPRIVSKSAEEAEFFEGCLSLGGFSALVRRSLEVGVECWDQNGRPRRIDARGWFARILQHEIDHLQGCLYIDRMEPRSFTTLDNLNQQWKHLPIPEVRKKLGIANP